MDARLPGVLHRFPAAVDVGQAHSGEAANGWAVLQRPDLPSHLARRLEILVRRDREARLDHVDPEPRQLARELELLHGVHGEARRLLAVPQRGIEDDDAVHRPAYVDSLVASSTGVGAATGRPSTSLWSGPDIASPVKSTNRKRSCLVATIMMAKRTTSSVCTGRRRTKSTSLKLQ